MDTSEGDIGESDSSVRTARDVDELVDLLNAWCTGGHSETDYTRYRELRQRLLRDPSLRPYLPDFLSNVYDLSAYWKQAKEAWGSTYAERRHFLQSAFGPVRSHLEALEWGAPLDEMIRQGLGEMNVPVIEGLWDKALSRRDIDPDGAITAARTLLETVCKHILDDLQEAYADDADLPTLYRLVSTRLRLAPDKSVEEPLRRIFGSCATIVENIGRLRNRVSDAHGRGSGGTAASPHYAALAVNLSGALAAFLCAAWEQEKWPF